MEPPSESDLIRQRRANLAAIQALGVPLYPTRFDRTDTVTALIDAHGGKDAATLE
jgi:hypothetical protein